MAKLRAPETLTTARLWLRPLGIADATDIWRYASDPLVTRFVIFPTHRNPAESEAFARRCAECWANGTSFPWAMVERASGDFIGAIELRLTPPKADFAYILCRAHWGRGFASEAAHAVVAWAIAQPAIHRVWTTVAPDNAASARVLEKAGLRLEARLVAWAARPNNGEIAGDSLMYALTRPHG